MRVQAFQIQFENGFIITDLRYDSFEIYNGKKPLCGPPSTYVESDEEAATLELYLIGKLKNLEVILTYTVV